MGRQWVDGGVETSTPTTSPTTTYVGLSVGLWRVDMEGVVEGVTEDATSVPLRYILKLPPYSPPKGSFLYRRGALIAW